MAKFFTTANITDLLVVVVTIGMGLAAVQFAGLFTDRGLMGVHASG
jgi:hypothetical protein